MELLQFRDQHTGTPLVSSQPKRMLQKLEFLLCPMRGLRLVCYLFLSSVLKAYDESSFSIYLTDVVKAIFLFSRQENELDVLYSIAS